MNSKTILIIPCFNEEKRLNIDAFNEFILSQDQIDLYFINDGSSDNTLSLINKYFSSNNRILVQHLTKNGGKANAIRIAALSILNLNRYDYIGFWDADLATPLNESLDMNRILLTNSSIELIVASRWKRLGSNIKRNLTRHYLGRVFATCASIIIGLPVYDTQCGSKIFKTTYLDNIMKDSFISKWFFDVEIFIRYKKIIKNNNVQWAYEYPIYQWKEIKGSKVKLIDFLKVPIELIKIKYHYERKNY